MKNASTEKRRTVAYLRVSTVDQDLEKNKADILLIATDEEETNSLKNPFAHDEGIFPF
jgi:hypothetical protein